MYPETKTYLEFDEGLARYEEIGWIKSGQDGEYAEGNAFLDKTIDKQKLANAIHSNIRTMEFGNMERNNQYFNTLSGLYADLFIKFIGQGKLIMLVSGNLICDSDIDESIRFLMAVLKEKVNMQHYLEGNCN